jgi:hypothetical protein
LREATGQKPVIDATFLSRHRAAALDSSVERRKAQWHESPLVQEKFRPLRRFDGERAEGCQAVFGLCS